MECKGEAHGVYEETSPRRLQLDKRERTDIEVWNQLRHGLPCHVHGAQALT